MITVQYYRTLTGACDMGCRDWLNRNNIPYKIIDGKTVESEPMRADDLVKILDKNTYGSDKFRELITF